MYKIKQLYDAGKFERAVLRADALDKDDWDASMWLDYHKMIGHSCFQIRLFPRALDHFSVAVNLAPDHFGTRYDRCHTLAVLARIEEALTEAAYLYANAPHHPEYLELYAELLTQTKQYELGLSISQELLDLDPENEMALDWCAYFQVSAGHYREALETYKEILKIHPLDENTANNIGYCYDKAGSDQLAAKYYRLALEANPYQAYTLNNLGYLLYRNGEKKEGWKLIRRSVNMDPTNSYVYKIMALVALAEEDREQAYEMLRKALELGYAQTYDDEVDRLLAREFPEEL